MKTLFASTQDHRYPIYIGTGLLHDHSLIQQHIRQKQVMIFSNETVAAHYLDAVESALKPYQTDVFLLPDGEQYKNETHWHKMINALAAHGHHRDTTLIALGGGVIGDMTGFAAACYQRGVNYLQIPTTLLAQVDSSIGGKTGINHSAGKNLIGAFHQPTAVIIDTATLHTLSDRELSAGLAEIVKVALIQDAAFFNWLETHHTALQRRDTTYLIHAILRACEIKRDIVNADEKETHGLRALLNLGHTFGHAIERIQGYGQCLHGEAVSIGICLASRTSMHLGWLSKEEHERIEQLLIRLCLPTRLPSEINYDTLLSTMMIDKKVAKQKLCLVLLKSIGQATTTYSLTSDRLKQTLAAE